MNSQNQSSCKYCSDDQSDEYIKYKNPDSSTAIHTPGIVDKIIKQTEEIISSEARRIYKVRPEAIIARDLRHAVFRELAYKVNKEVLKIDQFEKENSADIRNFDSDEEEQN